MQSRLEAGLEGHGLTRLKWCVLTGVEVEGHVIPSDLAEHIGITRPAVSRLLKAMVQDELIDRSLTEADGRSRQISVTEKGLQKLNACWPLVQANQDHFLGKLSNEQRVALEEALHDMIAGETDRFEDL